MRNLSIAAVQRGDKTYKRLIFYKCPGNKKYWDNCWTRIETEDLLGDRFFEEMFRRHIPKSGRVLENGCGLCQNVKILADMGFSAEGVDFSKLAVVKGKGFDRKLSVMVGEALLLPYLNGSFASCVSLGVVEHFKEGPEKPLNEINRIMVNEGVLLISVPYFNPLRKINSFLGRFSSSRYNSSQFYQYAFNTEEFKQILRESGFSINRVVKFDALEGIKELPFAHQLQHYFQKGAQKNIANKSSHKNNPELVKRVLIAAINSKLASFLFGHMILFVAEKREQI